LRFDIITRSYYSRWRSLPEWKSQSSTTANNPLTHNCPEIPLSGREIELLLKTLIPAKMKIHSLTGLSLILVSTLTVLAESQLAALSSPKFFPATEATYVRPGKKQTHVENRPQRRDSGLSTGASGTAKVGANGVVFSGGVEGTASQDRKNNTQECRVVSVKVSTTPAVYRAPDGHIFQMQQPIKEEVLNNNPWTACPNK
jgi:hypothetical protein